jgi:hypothetical protein
MAPILVSEEPTPALAEVGYATASRDAFDYVFTATSNSFAYYDDGVWSADSSVLVMINASHLWGSAVVADGDWRSCLDASAWVAPAPAKAADENRRP